MMSRRKAALAPVSCGMCGKSCGGKAALTKHLHRCPKVADQTATAHQTRVRISEIRSRMRPLLPPLAVRVFALRATPYPGCGFHYSLEMDIGRLLYELNDFNRNLSDAYATTLEAIYEDVLERVTRAEAAVEEMKETPVCVWK